MKYKETEELVKKLDFHFRNRGKWICTLNAPRTLTTKDRRGQFRKTGFIGGEGMTAQSAYMGKRGHIILVFSPTQPRSDYAFIEMSLQEATEGLTGFENNLTVFLADLGDDSLLDDDGKLRVLDAAAREAELAADTRWGSW